MEPVTSVVLQAFFERLSERYRGAGELYLLGGSALCLLGNPRETLDIDYTVELPAGEPEEGLRAALAGLATEMRLDLERVPLAEFIPLPPRARERRRLVGRFGSLDVYIFDLYSIALSKIARGFESDLEDVLFMLHDGLIEFTQLESHFAEVLPQAPEADIVPSEFRGYFEEVRRRIER
jgi:hypothetical protein